MATLEMNGTYDMTTGKIDEIVDELSAGNYALGYLDDANIFRVQYVGRSDTNVNDRLKKHIGEGYKKFKYSYASTARMAFEKECKNYHDFGECVKLANKIHPDRPADKDWECPYCNNF
jgi:hypothetical protein